MGEGKRRLIDLRVPLMNESREPTAFVPHITYMTPAAAARQMAKHYGISIDCFSGGVGLAQVLVTLSVHSGIHVDAPSLHANGQPPMSIDQVPLEWCYGDGVLQGLMSLSGSMTLTSENVLGRGSEAIADLRTQGAIA